jgi:hypothetical protein
MPTSAGVSPLREECLGRMIFFGESSLLRAIQEYVNHDHLERPHQGTCRPPKKARAMMSPSATTLSFDAAFARLGIAWPPGEVRLRACRMYF